MKAEYAVLISLRRKVWHKEYAPVLGTPPIGKADGRSVGRVMSMYGVLMSGNIVWNTVSLWSNILAALLNVMKWRIIAVVRLVAIE